MCYYKYTKNKEVTGVSKDSKKQELRAVYADIRDAMNRLSGIADAELAAVKRQMYVLEDMLWQIVKEEES